MRIGFLGFGEAARAFRASLAVADPAAGFLAWDRLSGTPSMDAAMAAAGVAPAAGPEGLAPADWVISAVTADQSLLALQALAPHLRQGQLVIDINSVSPGRKRDSAALVEARGAVYLDMAVMAPVLPRGHATPMLLAGGTAAARIDGLLALGFAGEVAGAEPGAATAIKMVRSLFVKGLEALTVETLLAAEASGCGPAILASLTASYPGLGWPGIAAYQFERVLTHGLRRAAEMDESGATLDALGLNGELARQIAAVQRQTAGLGAAPDAGDPGPGLAALVAARRAASGGG